MRHAKEQERMLHKYLRQPPSALLIRSRLTVFMGIFKQDAAALIKENDREHLTYMAGDRQAKNCDTRGGDQTSKSNCSAGKRDIGS